MRTPTSTLDTCLRKIRYKSKDEANAAKRQMTGSYRLNVAYNCPWCKGVHLGRKGQRR